ncbi:pyridoxal phosphate-dependent aminotransferase [Candidatus Woesearchaeota archaeon]|nr:pyridoxal phosphate-dependent aminotransferase [Candidatus Woesearchaeota archaeon]
MNLSKKINDLHESKTVKFATILAKLKQEGKSIINFAMGELDFPTPQIIIDATKKALDGQKTKYTATGGISELKHELIKKIKRVNNIDVNEKEIIVTIGAKQGIYNALQALCNPEDEVIIPTPYWVSFPEQVKLADAVPRFVPTRNNHLDKKLIEQAITKKTKAIIINSPCNPTGAVYSQEELDEIITLAEHHSLFILSDETYEDLVYTGKHISIASLHPNAKKRTISFYSFSKIYSMTGFRIGYVVADPLLIQMMEKLQSHTTTNACTFAQYGALAALTMDAQEMNDRINELTQRRDIAYACTKELFPCVNPEGAFYLFPEVTPFAHRHGSCEEFVAYLLEKAGVAVVAGDAFGSPNHIRISYACSQKDIKEGFQRIRQVIS